MKQILVTGGAGFIGSHLCRRLVKNGNQVTCLDNLFSGSLNNVSDLYSFKNFEFVPADIVKPFKFKGSLDEIYNLACIASPVGYQNRPVETLLVNSLGVKNMLDLAVLKKAKFLQTSTSEVYGDPKEHPQKESYWGNVNPIGLRSCYDEGKRFAESLIFTYQRLYHLEVKVVRIFNTYGPNMQKSDGRVVSNFILQAVRNEPLPIHGRGQQTRSLCYVDDLVEGLILMMKSRQSGPINLGNPREFTIISLAKIVKKITASQSKLVYVKRPADDPTLRRPDISLAKRFLGWQPKVELEEGIARSLPYFRKVLGL